MRFWSNFDRSGECWIWRGGLNNRQRGRMLFNGRRYTIHRLAYLLSHGTLPDDAVVRHKCDTPMCGRPDHLELGTQADNIADMVRRKRHRVFPNHKRPRGEANHAKLTGDQVREMRHRYVCGGVTMHDLANSYGVGYSTVNAIIHHRKWQHVE